MSSALRRIAAAYGDPYGLDLTKVKIPQTGFAAIGPIGGAMPTDLELKNPSWTLPEGWGFLGLFTQDGGPEETTEAGDAIKFFQLGYELPSGDDDMAEALTLAEDNAAVRRLVYGPNATDDQILYRKAGAVPVGSFPYLRVTRYSNGTEMRRAGLVHVTAIETERETRGEIRAHTITFAFEFQTDLGPEGAWWRDAFIDQDTPEPPAPPEPDPLDVTPGEKTIGPGGLLKLAVSLNGEPIPAAALGSLVVPSNVASFETILGDPYIRAAADGDGPATVTLTYTDGEGETHTGTVEILVAADIPALIFDGTPPNLWPDVEGRNAWSTGIFLDLETPMQVSGGHLDWEETTPGIVSALATDAGGWSVDFAAETIGETAVVFSWDDGLEGGAVHVGTLNLTVEEDQPVVVPETFTLPVGGEQIVTTTYLGEPIAWESGYIDRGNGVAKFGSAYWEDGILFARVEAHAVGEAVGRYRVLCPDGVYRNAWFYVTVIAAQG